MGNTRSYGILVKTIQHAGGQLLKFLVTWVVTVTCFGVMGMVTFGNRLEEWADLWSSIETLHMMVTGEYGYAPLIDVSAVYAAIFYLLYLVLVYFLLVNILLAIMMESYSACVEQSKMSTANDKEKNINIPVWREIMLETVEWTAKSLPSCLVPKGWLKVFDIPEFLGTEDLLRLLDPDEHPGLLKDCRTVTAPATLNDPDPSPRFFLSFTGLLMCFPQSHAQLIVARFGLKMEESQFDAISL